MKRWLVIIATTCFGLFAPASNATIINLSATLTGAQEVPPVVTSGTGFATFIIDTTLHTLTIDLSFANLTGTTTASHIHCCTGAPGVVSGVATTVPTFVGFPLGVTAGTFHTVLDLTSAGSYNPAFVTAQGSIAAAEAALVAGMQNGLAYINVHTSFRTGGEIRGNIVPEPASLALVAAGLIAARLSRRIRR